MANLIIMVSMKKSLFSFLGLSAISVFAVNAQTNAPAPSPSPAAPAPVTASPLSPPPDAASATATAPTVSPTAPPTAPNPPVQAPAPVVVPTASPTPTPTPIVNNPVPTPTPIVVNARTATTRVSATAPAPKPHLRRPYHLTPISWIVATRDKIHYDDRYVTIIGHVTRRIGDDEYWFSDGTGSVRLDSENFDLPVGRRLVVGGRIDQAWLGFGHLEVDVRRWRYDR